MSLEAVIAKVEARMEVECVEFERERKGGLQKTEAADIFHGGKR